MLVDNILAGVVWPFAVIYTGGITPSNWRPLTSYGAYDAPTYWIDVTPFLPILLDESVSHNITLQVRGQGADGASINSNWFVSGSVHGRVGTGPTTGRMSVYEVEDAAEFEVTGGASADNATLWTKVVGGRHLKIESELQTAEGTKTVSFVQDLGYRNDGTYADEGWLQVRSSCIPPVDADVLVLW